MNNKSKLVKSLLSEMDKLQMENHILSKQNEELINLLHADAQDRIKSIFNEEQQKWIDLYIKNKNLDKLLELLDID